MEQLSDLSIYYPDILDGSTMIGDKTGQRSYYKDVIDTDDEEVKAKARG